MEIFISEFLRILDVVPTDSRVYLKLASEFSERLKACKDPPLKFDYEVSLFLKEILKLESQVRIALAIKKKI
jgi:hypothetical protein